MPFACENIAYCATLLISRWHNLSRFGKSQHWGHVMCRADFAQCCCSGVTQQIAYSIHLHFIFALCWYPLGSYSPSSTSRVDVLHCLHCMRPCQLQMQLGFDICKTTSGVERGDVIGRSLRLLEVLAVPKSPRSR